MQFVELLGILSGLLYLWLEYRASIYLWVASIIMPSIYLIIYYDAGLYADLAMNIYYLLIAIYGWAAWRYGFSLFRQSSGEELAISHTPKRLWLPIALLTILLFVVMAQLLTHFTDSTVPWSDAFTSALSIVGMWLLARKYIEQWWVWFVVDVASVGLYIHKDLYLTAALYMLYAVVVVFGYRKWKQLMYEQDAKG